MLYYYIKFFFYFNNSLYYKLKFRDSKLDKDNFKNFALNFHTLSRNLTFFELRLSLFTNY